MNASATLPALARLGSAVAALCALAACATTPPSYPALDSARSSVAAAAASPQATRYAAEDLKHADDLLRSADAAARERKPALVTHYAYMASQMSRVALAVGAGKAADEYVAHGEEEREKIQLAARTRELNVARADAQRSTAQAQSAEAARDRFQEELASLEAQKTARGTVITLKDMLFASGQAELQPGAEHTLDTVATALKDATTRAVAVEGFTDSVGAEAFNDALSQRRAEAVRAALQQRGVDASRITVRGYDEQYPVASNATAAGRQLNRRVEIIVSDAGGEVAARSGP